MQVIRRYAKTDLEQMAALDPLCFAPEFAFDRESMRRFAEARNSVTFVAEADGGILVGFVIAHLESRGSGLRGYIVTLDVSPTFRRAGAATRLMQRVEDEVVLELADSVELHVYVRNENAIKFYEARGYCRLGLEEQFYGGVGMDAYVYRKDLLIVTRR